MRYLLSTSIWLTLIVVGLPILFTVITWPRLSDINQSDDVARGKISILCDAVALYSLHVGQPPADLEALRVAPDDLPGAASWQGPYLDKPIPVDPWGNDYRYALDVKVPGTVCIWSCGKDGISGTADDLSSNEFQNSRGAPGLPIWNPFGWK